MFDLPQTLPKYLGTFLHENAVMTIGLTDQSDYSICLPIGQTFQPDSNYIFCSFLIIVVIVNSLN